MKLVFILLLFSIALAHPSQADIAFSPPTTYEPGVIAKWVGVADFDEDGNPDLVISQTDSSRVVLLLGHGDGTFPSRVSLSLSAPPYAGATGDLNGDGHVDLVVATVTGVTVLLGKGNGTFLPLQSFPALSRPLVLRIADLDEDGRPDLVFPDGGHTVHVLWQDAQGAFAPESTYATDGDGPDGLVVGDFNHDGHLDVATSDYGHAVCCWDLSVLLGHGSRAVGPATRYAANVNPMTISAADLDGNGSLDLLSAGDLGGFTLLVNRGDGTFDRAPFGSGVGTDGLWDATLADLDRDGAPDFAAATSNGVLVDRGLGDGQFALVDTLTMSTIPRTIVAADLDHDTRPDLVTAGNGVTVFLNQTPTVSAPSPRLAFSFVGPRPNPARHEVTFEFSLPEASPATLSIFDLSGRVVATIAAGTMAAGPHRVDWNLRSQAGRSVGAGIYFARLTAGSRHITHRVEVLR